MKVNGALRLFSHWRLEFHGEGKLHIQGKVTIGQNFHSIVGEGIYIEDGVVMAPDVYISSYESYHRNQQHKLIKHRPHYGKSVRIGKNVFIGKNVMIMPGVTISENAVIGAGSIIKNDVAEGEVIAAQQCH